LWLFVPSCQTNGLLPTNCTLLHFLLFSAEIFVTAKRKRARERTSIASSSTSTLSCPTVATGRTTSATRPFQQPGKGGGRASRDPAVYQSQLFPPKKWEEANFRIALFRATAAPPRLASPHGRDGRDHKRGGEERASRDNPACTFGRGPVAFFLQLNPLQSGGRKAETLAEKRDISAADVDKRRRKGRGHFRCGNKNNPHFTSPRFCPPVSTLKPNNSWLRSLI